MIYPTNQQVNKQSKAALNHFWTKNTPMLVIRAQDQLIMCTKKTTLI